MTDLERTHYADHERREMAAYVPHGTRRMLDVGCGGGGFGAYLKSLHHSLEVVGVEPDAVAAERAASRLDAVKVGSFPSVELTGTFDVIFFNDVLEHMADPGPALSAASELTSTVVASLPNVRHIDVVRDLVLRGNWNYSDDGVLDRTHLRFYTKRSAISLFEANGYEVIRADAINRVSSSLALRIGLRLIRDRNFLPLQFVLVGVHGSRIRC